MFPRFLLWISVAAVVTAQDSSSLTTPSGGAGYQPITAEGRMKWVVSGAIGPANMIAGAFTAGLATRTNSPEEYGTHWAGFGKRVGIGMTGRATSGLMEASLGSLWGEDPRYFRATGKPFGSRLNNVFRMTYTAHDRRGNEMPSYARYIAIPGSAFLSNTWRPDSQTQLADTLGRMTFTLVTHVIGNAFSEFGPDLRKRFSKKKDVPGSGN